jgi:hypothetical protein
VKFDTKTALSLAATVMVEPELAAWVRLGRRPKLWWRDDDARSPTAAFDRLLAVVGNRPLALAIIPTGDLDLLAATLMNAPHVVIGQHGVDHINRAAQGRKKSEYREGVSVEEIAAALELGRRRLSAAGLSPEFFTPPWNAGEPDLGDALARLQFTRWSAGPTRRSHPALRYAATDIDLLRWTQPPQFRGVWKVMRALQKALSRRRSDGDFNRPIGLLTHHLAHDEATWGFLDSFLAYLEPKVEWVSIREIGSR